MHYRKFGKTGVSVSEIGHGTWAMGSMWGPKNDREAVDSLVRSIELGVNFIDTASAYGEGHSETLISTALKKTVKKVFVATKVPPKNRQWPARAHVPVHDAFPAKHIILKTEQSLKNLRMGCIDLQQLHVWTDNWLVDGDWPEAVEKLKREGKIKFFGISINNHDPDSALKIVESGLVDSIQVIYNIFEQRPEETLFPLCLEKGVAVIARVPFDEGSLTGGLKPDTVFHKNDWRQYYFTPERLKETFRRVERLKFLVQEEVKTLSQAALKFCLSHTAVSTVIPGMRTTRHVEENCPASDGKYFTAHILSEIKKHAWPRNFYPTYG